MVKFRISIRGRTYTVEITRAQGESFDVKIKNKLLQVKIGKTADEASLGERKMFEPSASLKAVERVKRAITQTTHAVESHISPLRASDVIKAPLPGNLLEVKVNVGERVKKGDVVAIIVSMKMQNKVLAHRDGVVKEIRASPSSFINKGDILVLLNHED